MLQNVHNQTALQQSHNSNNVHFFILFIVASVISQQLYVPIYYYVVGRPNNYSLRLIRDIT